MAEKRGGKRAGSGRPKGKLDKRTIDRNKIKAAYLDRIAKNADELFNAQFSLARGLQMLFMIETDSKGNKRPAQQITDTKTIKQYLDGELNGEGSDEYYFIAAQKPDNKAITDMLNRSFGKPQDHIDITSKGEKIVSPKIRSTIKARKPKK